MERQKREIKEWIDGALEGWMWQGDGRKRDEMIDLY